MALKVPAISRKQTLKVAKVLGLRQEDLKSIKIGPRVVEATYYHRNDQGNRYARFVADAADAMTYTVRIPIHDGTERSASRIHST